MKKIFLTTLMLLMAFFSCHVCAKEPVNVALKKPVAASNQEAANPAAHMTDGNTATRWSASNAWMPQWAIIDLGEPCLVSEITGVFYEKEAYEFKLSATLDGTNFFDIYHGYGNTATGIFDLALDEAMLMRKLRVDILGSPRHWASIHEISVMGIPMGRAALVSENKPVTAISEEAANTASMVNDGNVATRWSTAKYELPAYIVIDLEDTYQLDHIDGFMYCNPALETTASYEISFSTDGVNYSSAVSGTSDPKTGYFTNINLHQKAARYVKLTVNAVSPAAWASVAELRVYAMDGTLVCLNDSVQKVTATSEEAANPKENIISVETNTRWSASDFTIPQMITLDFGQAQTITTIAGQMYHNSVHQGNFRYIIEVSTDGENYFTVTNSNAHNGAGGFIYADIYHRARYLRFRIIGSPNHVWASMHYLSVWGIADETPMADVSVSYEEDGAYCTVNTVGLQAEDRVIFARYTDDGRLQYAESKPVAQGHTPTLHITEDGAWAVKAFVMDGTTGSIDFKAMGTGKIALGTPSATDSWRTSKAFANHMVLDSDCPLIYGFDAAPGEKIYASIAGVTACGYGKADGSFNIRFPKLDYNTTGQTLTVYNDRKSETFTDILIGDVYFIGGQSNADYEFNRTHLYNADLAAMDTNMPIRYMVQDGTDGNGERPCKEPYSGNQWQALSRDTVGKLSGFGYYFAERIAKGTNNTVPIGFVQISEPGAHLQMLSPNAVNDYFTAWEGATLITNIGGAWIHNNYVASFEKMKISGMIYYQGESDSAPAVSNYLSNPNEQVMTYTKRFAELVSYYRKTTKSNFPVYNVTLTTYGAEWVTEKMRTMQTNGCYEIDDYYAIASFDCGYLSGIGDSMHPPYKKPLGYRLGDIALAVKYDKLSLEYAHGPLKDSVVYDGNTATITFRYVGDGLKAIGPNGGQLLGFEGVTTSGQPISVSAEIVGKNQIKLTASQNLAGVRYAYFRYATLKNANMANSAGKLMLPFTDGAEAQSFTMGTLDTVHTPAENY